MANLVNLPGLTIDANMPEWLKSLMSGSGGQATAPGGLSTIAPNPAAMPVQQPGMMGAPPPSDPFAMLPQVMAGLGVPPPTTGVPNIVKPPAGTAITPPVVNSGIPNPNISQSDLMNQGKPAVSAPVPPGEPMILPGAPGSPEDIGSALAGKKLEPKSPLSQVQAPEAPKGVTPSTPATRQTQNVNLDPMMHILQMALGGGKQAATVLPQLSAFLQRRPQG